MYIIMHNKTYVYVTNPCNLNAVFCIGFKRGELKKNKIEENLV